MSSSNASSKIRQLLQRNEIWQASQKDNPSTDPERAISTGYAELDKELHYTGWPRAAISELLLSNNGIGEIRLLSPLFARLSLQSGYITWVNPPEQPYAPALTQQFQLNKLVIVNTCNTQDSIWAAEQAMASAACSAVLLWLPDKALNKALRKLSIAARKGKCWGIILRPASLQQHPSPAALRIVMQPKKQHQQLSIIKQPGGWSGQQVRLNLFPERKYWTPLSVEHWPCISPLIRQNNFVSKENLLNQAKATQPSIISKQITPPHH